MSESGLPAVRQRFLEWLLLPPGHRVPSTVKEWAAENDVCSDTPARWKKDARFVREWDRRCAELNVNPERVQAVVDALWAKAADGDVKAASLYLQYTERFVPQQKVQVGRDVSSLSDAELVAELEDKVVELRAIDGGLAGA
tara:strand:+ start:1349 stop:1771 length:423 start_codon:yes stop_codon:yes gene_type:complete